MSEYKVIKSSVEVYKLRTSTGFDWANIYINEFGNSGGELVIYSDYGNWAYTWPNCRETFKKYLSEMEDKYYMMKKLNGTDPKIINFDATEKEMRSEMVEEHNMMIRNAEEDGDMDEVEKIKLQIAEDEEELNELFQHEYWGDQNLIYVLLVEYFDGLFERIWASDWEYLPIVKEYNSGLTMFCNKIWPCFIEQLKKEIHEQNNSSGQNLST